MRHGLLFVPLHFLISFLIPSHLIPSHNWFFDMLAFFQALLFWTAPVGVTILGWVAVSQIRRSAGKLYGLWLAVFDGLLFPLLALDGLIIGTFYLGLLLADQELKRFHAAPIGIPLVLLIPIVLGVVALADFFIIRRVWRAVNKGGAGVPPAEPGVAPGSAARQIRQRTSAQEFNRQNNRHRLRRADGGRISCPFAVGGLVHWVPASFNR